MCDKQSLRSACAYAQSDQSFCKTLEYSMSAKLLAEHHLEFLNLKEAVHAHLSLHLSKCHIVGNHMSRLICVPALGTHCHSFLANILHKGYAKLKKVRHILWKLTIEASSCMVLMSSILCQYYRTFCFFPKQVVHAVLVQRVFQQPCNGLAWDESSPPAHQLHQSGSDT